jgi:hypothetical protein
LASARDAARVARDSGVRATARGHALDLSGTRSQNRRHPEIGARPS